MKKPENAKQKIQNELLQTSLGLYSQNDLEKIKQLKKMAKQIKPDS
ncbi:MAG: hypothetical protein V1777_05070 [Candidatus Micrarchaeota archaeon]